MDVERLRPAQDANEVASEQVKAFVRLPHEDEEALEERAAPLFVFDAGYDPVKLQQALEGCHVRAKSLSVCAPHVASTLIRASPDRPHTLAGHGATVRR
jgi:hypothetical protein